VEKEEDWAQTYFNSEYGQYWRKKTHSDDADKPADVDQFREIFSLAIEPRKLLDAGCGFGRLFPVFIEKGFNVYGIDICKDIMKIVYVKDDGETSRNRIKELKVGRLENIEYPDEFFDVVVAWAVFDSVQQERALREILRVLRIGGIALITGKNDNYFPDDKQAIVAEIAAKQKGHPNYFTDYKRMVECIYYLGGAVVSEYFFPRRGDFGRNVYVTKQPDKFYEWCIVIRKELPTPDEGKTEECSFSSPTSLVGNKVR
jgi:ubiquinone/menaquinone biosynthesis C-methylase UbiE